MACSFFLYFQSNRYAVGIRIRSSITHAIYAKSLRISPSAKKDTTTGEVVNLMSVDVQRMVDL